MITFFELYLKDIKQVSPSTIKAYSHDVIKFIDFIDLKNNNIDIVIENLKNIKQEHILLFLDNLKQKKVSTTRLARVISSLKVFWKFLSYNYNIVSCVDSLVSPKISYKLPVYCSHENITEIIEFCDKDISFRGVRNSLLVRMLYYTGLSPQALVLIKKEEVILNKQIDSRELLVKSSIGVYSLPIADNFFEKLEDYLEKCNNILFPIDLTGKQESLSAQAVWALLNKLFFELGLVKKVSSRDIISRDISRGKVHKLDDAFDKVREIYDKNHPRS